MENNGCFDGAQGKHRKKMREIDTDDAFQEVGPHVEYPPKFLWNKPFHRKVIGIDAQFFVPKGHIGIFLHRIQKFLHFSFVPKEA